MKSLAKKLVGLTPNTKIVRVEGLETSPQGQCWENAKQHSQDTGSKIVNGWIVMPGDFCLRDDAIGIFCKHYWNKLNGRYVDTTMHFPFNDFTYVLNKEDCIGFWLQKNAFQYVLKDMVIVDKA